MVYVPPLFSIITPAFNSQKWICRCLDSVLSQSYTDWELILIDDGSTDNTSTIAEKYAKVDPRIKVFHQENKGWCYSTNRAVFLAKGAYLFSLDSDNFLETNSVLSEMAQAIQKDSPDIVQIPLRFVKEDSLETIETVPGVARPSLLSTRTEVDRAYKSGDIYIQTHGGKAIRHEIMSKVPMVGNANAADTRAMGAILALCNSCSILSGGGLCCECRKDSLSRKGRPNEFFLDYALSELKLFNIYNMLFSVDKKRVFPQLERFFEILETALLESWRQADRNKLNFLRNQVAQHKKLLLRSLPAKKKIGLLIYLLCPKCLYMYCKFKTSKQSSGVN